MTEPSAMWCQSGGAESSLLKVARTVLRREARLVEALEKDAMAFDIAKQPLNAARVREVLAAHRAATRPEPTLAEAVERMFGNATRVLPFVSVPMEFKRDDVEAVKAALAREQERGR